MKSALALLLPALLLAGCNSPDVDPARGASQQTPEALLQNALARLKEEKPSLAGYRSAVQQFNVYMEKPDKPLEFALSPELRRMLIDTMLVRVPDNARRLKELEAKTFAAADAGHLDSCILFRDAARSLQHDLGPQPGRNDEAAWRAYNLRLAGHVFDWAMRQVPYTPRFGANDAKSAVAASPNEREVAGLAWPAHDILRRGTGDGEERLRVYLGLMEQLNLFRTEERRLIQIDALLAQKPDAERQKQLEKEKEELASAVRRFRMEAGAVTRQVDTIDGNGARTSRDLPWAAGIVIGGEAYLFEPRLGRAIPGPDGKGVATWRQVQQDPNLLKAFYQGDDDPVTPAQLAKAELHLAFSLPALAPRMLWLEARFEEEGTLFHQDPPARFAHLAATNPGLPARAWSKAGAPGYPLTLLNQYAESAAQQTRLRDQIVPYYLLPDWVKEMYRELATNVDRNQLVKDFDEIFLKMRVEPGGVRDLLVRGRPEEAVQRILMQEDRIDKAMDANNRDFNAIPYMRKAWVPRVLERSKKIAELVQELKKATNDAENQAIGAKIGDEARYLEMLWRDRREIFRTQAVVWAVPEYRAHLTYFMALAKMDLARRAEQRQRDQAGEPWPADLPTPPQLWASAQEWLRRYQAIVLPLGRDPWQNAVTRQLEICRMELAKPTAAK